MKLRVETLYVKYHQTAEIIGRFDPVIHTAFTQELGFGIPGVPSVRVFILLKMQLIFRSIPGSWQGEFPDYPFCPKVTWFFLLPLMTWNMTRLFSFYVFAESSLQFPSRYLPQSNLPTYSLFLLLLLVSQSLCFTHVTTCYRI